MIRNRRTDAEYLTIAETAPVHIIPMELTPANNCYFGKENYGHVFDATINLRGDFTHQGRNCTYALNYGDEHHTTRLEFGGPIVQQEHAYLVALPTVIAAHYIERPPVIDVADGDILMMLGRKFQIRDNKPLYNPRLVRIDN